MHPRKSEKTNGSIAAMIRLKQKHSSHCENSHRLFLEGETMNKAFVREIRSIPAISTLACGIAFALFASETRSLYPLTSSYASLSIAQGINIFVTVGILAAVSLVCWTNPQLRLSKHRWLVVLCGATLFASTGIVFGLKLFSQDSLPPLSINAAYTCYTLSSSLLAILWIERLEPLKAKHRFISTGLAILVCAGLELSVALLRDFAATALTAVASIITAVFLIRTIRQQEQQSASAEKAYFKKASGPALAITATLFLLTVLLVGNFRYSMEQVLPLNGASILGAEMLMSIGTALAGTLIIVAAILWMRNGVWYLCMLIPSCYCIVFLLLQVCDDSSVIIAIVPLTLMRKISLVIPLLLIQSCKDNKHFALIACFVVALYRTGQIAGTAPLFKNIVDSSTVGYNLIVIALISVLLGLSIALVALQARNRERSSQSQDNTDTEDALARKARAVQNIAARFGLTTRETDILHYLADGWHAAPISEKLTLSHTTVKNHMGRIYKKLDVHAQQEILSMVEKEIKHL